MLVLVSLEDFSRMVQVVSVIGDGVVLSHPGGGVPIGNLGRFYHAAVNLLGFSEVVAEAKKGCELLRLMWRALWCSS